MKHSFFPFLLMLCLFALFAACDGQPNEMQVESWIDPATIDGPWTWELGEDGVLRFWRGERLIQSWTAVTALRFEPRVWMLFGFFHIKRSTPEQIDLTFAADDGQIKLMDGARQVGVVRIAVNERDDLTVALQVNDANGYDGLRLSFIKNDGDRFWGFGEQYNHIDLIGQRVPVWTSEQGVGRSPHPAMPTTGDLTDTYFPMPYFLDPAQGKGFLLDNSEYSLFDLGRTDADAWSVEVWNGCDVSFRMLPGPRPGMIVRQLTREVGRAKSVPPDWAFDGVILAAQGGTDAVLARLDTALSAGIPVTAVWVQDWVGIRHFGLGNYGVKYRWIHDEELYPDLAVTIADLREQGVRFLGYFNPFVCPDYELFEPGAQNGYLIKGGDGSPYMFIISVFTGSLLDVTDPAAADWFQDYAREAIDLGMSGWMADFGEWLPFNARLADGEAEAVHNLYPTHWHRLNREVLAEAQPDGDFFLLTRSGFTGEQKVAQVVWAGDQEASWDEMDGLPTVIKAGLTLGLAGIPYFTHDIAGFSGGPSTKELFLRWTELGAFTPIMRTHDGLQKTENHRFDSDEQTLAHFMRFSLIHNALAPYFRELAVQAQESGLPIIRHTALVDPLWSEALRAHDQWMIGQDMLFAPVVTEGATTVRVRFPAGEWEHLFTGQAVAGRCTREVDAPLGTPAVFVRRGALADLVAQVRQIGP